MHARFTTRSNQIASLVCTGVLDVCAIKSPGFGDRRRGYLEDIAVLTGATFVTEQVSQRVTGFCYLIPTCGRFSERCLHPFNFVVVEGVALAPPVAVSIFCSPCALLLICPRTQLGLSLETMTNEMLGKAARVSVSKERTTMIATGDHSAEVAERIKVIKAEGEMTDSEFDREKCQERVAKLGGAIGRIKVGAATETELKDKTLRCVPVVYNCPSPHNSE